MGKRKLTNGKCCLVCKMAFVGGIDPKSFYCSTKCRDSVAVKEKPDPPSLGYSSSAQPTPSNTASRYPFVCISCGKTVTTFSPSRAHKKGRCRNKCKKKEKE